MKSLLGVPVFVSIIATPDPVRGWDRPELTCWVVRCGDSVTMLLSEPSFYETRSRALGWKWTARLDSLRHYVLRL